MEINFGKTVTLKQAAAIIAATPKNRYMLLGYAFSCRYCCHYPSCVSMFMARFKSSMNTTWSPQ